MSSSDSSTYHIVYPRGDRAKLSVIELVPALSYELNDYAVACADGFDSYKDAADHARLLAKSHGKEFIPDEDEESEKLLALDDPSYSAEQYAQREVVLAEHLQKLLRCIGSDGNAATLKSLAFDASCALSEMNLESFDGRSIRDNLRP